MTLLVSCPRDYDVALWRSSSLFMSSIFFVAHFRANKRANRISRFVVTKGLSTLGIGTPTGREKRGACRGVLPRHCGTPPGKPLTSEDVKEGPSGGISMAERYGFASHRIPGGSGATATGGLLRIPGGKGQSVPLPERKASRPDGIPTVAAIKQLPRRAMVTMIRLFNGILRTGHFPGSWKTCCVIAIPKVGNDPRLVSNQRPITLLSHIAKLFERIMLRRLYRHLTPRQELFGFRSGHSTTLQLARVLSYMAAEHNRANIQIPPALVRTVASFLAGRSFFVSIEDAILDQRLIHTGVPQVSYLSPCLYAAFTDDISTLVGQLQDWEQDVVLALYANDSVYVASSRRADLTVAKL
ncbi:RNA-directed DNA polymerase from mobile element jockey [Eumeta japonica]|uniref:RNA-directed DNA polymerase from mobile element jockey n=1 Tax=Eumeta variegata TaxID=151549 RepID=A0A4C1VUB0_EUMVA|nr:RNA-directed DNA polymerase from mobile element jockey [Eumeta japonica]